MNSPTHILGGFVFTGTLCSFTDVNVFQNQHYIITCAVFSVLPDVDTTKSLIGKILYPVAWIINRKFGHRTITHSLAFLALVWLVIFSLQYFSVIQDKNLLKIVLFALVGHFIFDMITVSGVPLLYPFYKNPCVIPADPAFRFKSGDRRSEMVVTGLCGLLCVTMQPLFSQGFWTSYNRTFGTVQHVDRENRNTAFYVICDYSYIQNARTMSGNAIVIESTEKELTLFDRRHVFKLNSDNPQMKINYAKPRVSDIEKRFEELQFFNIDYDSLQVLLDNKLASGLIQSNQNVRYMEDAVSYFTNFIKFANRFDFHVYANIDSARSPVRANIARLESSIEETRRRHLDQLSRYNARVAGIQKIEDTLRSSTLSHYERNKLQKQLIALRNQNIDPPVYAPPVSLRSELAALKKSLSENNLLFSGHLTIFTFGYSAADRHATPTPDYDCQRLLASSSTPDPPD